MKLLTPSLLAAVLHCAACSTPPPTADAGAPPDAGAPFDAGAPSDAGAHADAGVATDAGSETDAGAGVDAGPNPYLATVVLAADAILTRQAADGALFVGEVTLPDNRLVPYFGNQGAIGLCLAFRETRDARYLTAAKRWLDWYAGHMNTDGTVYDFTLRGGVLTSDGTFDSTDSYAATFISAVRICRDASGDDADARARMPAIDLAVNALLLTYQADGLTFATPSYAVKYLQDNAEVFVGLTDAAALAGAFGTTAQVTDRSTRANRTLQALDDVLFLSGPERYAWALNGTLLESTPGQWYPDTMGQLMTIVSAPPSPRRSTLYATVRAQYFNVPAVIASDLDGEYADWWGVAAKKAGDASTVSQLSARFEAMNWATVRLRTPADYARVIELLAR